MAASPGHLLPSASGHHWLPFIAEETCLPGRCIATTASSGSAIRAFSRHVTICKYLIYMLTYKLGWQHASFNLWDFVYHRCSSCRWVKRQPCINLLYKYLSSLYRTYERTSAWWFASYWLKVSSLLGSLCVCLHLWVLCVECCCCQSYFTTGGLPPISSSWRQAPWDPRPDLFFPNWTPAVIVLM
jgi:hypothetical protein